MISVNGALRDKFIISSVLFSAEDTFTFDELFKRCKEMKSSFSSKEYLEKIIDDYQDRNLIILSEGRYHFNDNYFIK